MATKPTTDAIEILERIESKDPELATLVEVELRKFRIAEKIRQAREKAGLSQKELAKRINTTQSVVSRLESSGYERFSLNTLIKIATALNCNIRLDLEPIIDG